MFIILGVGYNVKYSFFKLRLQKKLKKKPFFFRTKRISQSISKLAHARFGFLTKKTNLSSFLKNFTSLTLKAEKHQAIKRLIYLKTYKGWRHERWLPVRGQSARTNAKTRRKRGIQ